MFGVRLVCLVKYCLIRGKGLEIIFLKKRKSGYWVIFFV